MKKITHEEYIAKLAKTNPNIEVLGTYSNSKTKILHKCNTCGHEWEVSPTCTLTKKHDCPKCSINKKTKTHEQYVLELNKINPTIKILEKYKNTHTKILHKCNICGYEWEAQPSDMLRGRGCPKCNNHIQKTKKQYETQLKTKQKDITLIGEYKNTHTKTLHKCNICGYEWNIAPKELLSNRGRTCPICNQSISFPNRIMYSLLNELKINYIREYSPIWAKNKRYDVYCPELELIIELHGEQHYKEVTGFNTSLKKQQKNDKHKKQNAINNGIKYYIEIDCSKSDFNYIKHNIKTSNLIKLIDLQNVNWDTILLQSSSNPKKNFWGYCNTNKKMYLKDIAQVCHISYATARSWLKEGQKFKLCDYTSPQKTKIINLRTKQIFNSITQASDTTKHSRNYIIKLCNEHKEFMYYDEYLQLEA